MSHIEYMILNSPLSLFIFYGAILLIIVVLKVLQNYLIYKKMEILYEEKPEPVMVTLVSYDWNGIQSLTIGQELKAKSPRSLSFPGSIRMIEQARTALRG